MTFAGSRHAGISESLCGLAHKMCCNPIWVFSRGAGVLVDGFWCRDKAVFPFWQWRSVHHIWICFSSPTLNSLSFCESWWWLRREITNFTYNQFESRMSWESRINTGLLTKIKLWKTAAGEHSHLQTWTWEKVFHLGGLPLLKPSEVWEWAPSQRNSPRGAKLFYFIIQIVLSSSPPSGCHFCVSCALFQGIWNGSWNPAWVPLTNERLWVLSCCLPQNWGSFFSFVSRHFKWAVANNNSPIPMP